MIDQTMMRRVLEYVDDHTLPGRMGPAEAMEFLEQLSTEIGTRIDGLKDDMRSKGQDRG